MHTMTEANWIGIRKELDDLKSKTANLGTGSFGPGRFEKEPKGLMDKTMVPAEYRDETSGPVTVWGDKVEGYLEDRKRGLGQTLEKCRKYKETGIIDHSVIQGWATEIEFGMAQQLWDFLLNRSEGECWRIIKNVKDKNGFEAYRQIHAAFDPQTETSSQILKSKVHALISHPAKKVEEARAAMNALENRVRVFEEHAEGNHFPDEEMLSILRNLMPDEIRKHMAADRWLK